MNQLYPLKFKPIFLEKIWGGSKIKTALGRDYGKAANCGEMWSLSGVEGNESKVSEGFLKGNTLNELLEIYMGDLVGDGVYEKCGNVFPVLIKFINSEDWLSIQVHPEDKLAQKRHGTSGKTEMWYIMEADKDAEIINGFNKKTARPEYLAHLNNKKLADLLKFQKVSVGDSYFIPAGRVHALGPGILLAEIQQTSDITYRIHDWDRLGLDGLPREMHTDLALDAIDFSATPDDRRIARPKPNDRGVLVQAPEFNVNIIDLEKPLECDFARDDSFTAYVCLDGSFDVECESAVTNVKMADTVLLPAELKLFRLVPKQPSRLLEIFIEQ